MRTQVLPAVLFLTCLLSSLASSTAAERGRMRGPIKVFILAGQSNMEGHGKVSINLSRNQGQGSLAYLAAQKETASRYAHTRDRDGNWVIRPDCWISYFDRRGELTVGYGAGADMIGPEFQFGHRVADHFPNQVLLIKTAWGGKSLVKDFRPPSSGGEVGPFYLEMIKQIRETLENLKAHFPEYHGRGFEIVGFGWHQGWNDGLTHDAVDQYEDNLVHLIEDIRREFKLPNLPVVIATSGFGGWEQKIDRRLGIIEAQLAVAKRLSGVMTVETRDFFRNADVSPSGQRYHWNHNAETHFLTGDAMAKGMIHLLTPARRKTKDVPNR